MPSDPLTAVVQPPRDGDQEEREKGQKRQGPLIAEAMEHLASDWRAGREEISAVSADGGLLERTQGEDCAHDISHKHDATQCRSSVVPIAIDDVIENGRDDHVEAKAEACESDLRKRHN